MAKTLATFRLEETDWKDFHDWARSQGSTATMELSRFVLGKLGKLDVPRTLDSNHLDTKLDALIDSKLEARLKDIQLLDDKLDDRIATLIDDKLDKRIDEKLSNMELAIAKIEIDALKPVAGEDDPIPDYSPIFVDPDPIPDPTHGLKGQELSDFLTQQGIKCDPSYLSNYKKSRHIPPKIKEVLDRDWVVKGKLWYPKQQPDEPKTLPRQG